jgi:hypothetical protein
MSWTGNRPKNRRKRRRRRRRRRKKKKKKKKKTSVFKYDHKEVSLSGTEMKRDGIKEEGKKETSNSKRVCGCGPDQGHGRALLNAIMNSRVP